MALKTRRNNSPVSRFIATAGLKDKRRTFTELVLIWSKIPASRRTIHNSVVHFILEFSTFLLVFVSILFQIETNLVKMRLKYFHSTVSMKSKLDYWSVFVTFHPSFIILISFGLLCPFNLMLSVLVMSLRRSFISCTDEGNVWHRFSVASSSKLINQLSRVSSWYYSVQ